MVGIGELQIGDWRGKHTSLNLRKLKLPQLATSTLSLLNTKHFLPPLDPHLLALPIIEPLPLALAYPSQVAINIDVELKLGVLHLVSRLRSVNDGCFDT